MKIKYDEIITFRVLREDKRELVDLARNWQLDESEIARRALRIGLKEIRSEKIFGTREMKDETKGNVVARQRLCDKLEP